MPKKGTKRNSWTKKRGLPKKGKKGTKKRRLHKRIQPKVIYVQGPQPPPQQQTVVGAAGQGLGWGFGFGAGEAVAENLFDQNRDSYKYGSAANYGSF